MAYATIAHTHLAQTSYNSGVKGWNKTFLAGVAIAMVLSSIVFFEPAPVDAVVLGLLILGLGAGIIGLRGLQPIAVIPLMLFVVANVVSMYDPLSSVRAVWYFLVTFYLCLSWVFFVGVLNAFGKRGMDIMIKGYTISAMICMVPGLLSYFHLIGFQSFLLRYGRPKGTFKDPNVYGPYVIPVALFAIAGVIAQRKGKKSALIHTFVALVCVAGVFLSYSRASWINLILSLFAYLFFSFMFRPAGTPSPFPVSRAVLSFIGAALCIGLVVQIPEVREMLAQRLTSNGLQSYDKDRFRTHELARESVLERPLGIGPGQAEATFHYATHSSFMRVLSENGFLGEAAFVTFILVCLGRGIVMGWRTQDEYWEKIFFIASACIVGHIVNSGVVDTIHWRHFWFLLAIPWYTPKSVPSRVRLMDAR